MSGSNTPRAWQVKASQYCARLGVAEYEKALRNHRRLMLKPSTFQFKPSMYYDRILRHIKENDEQAFVSLKFGSGASSAIGF